MPKYSYIAYIEGDTSGIVNAMKDVEEHGKDLNRRMKVINEGLKFNPESVELLGSKFDNLSEQLENAKIKFEALKSVEEQAKHSRETGNMSKDQYAYYQQQLAKAENGYKTLEIAVGTAKAQLDRAKEAMEQNAYATKGLAAVLSEVETAGKRFDSELKEIDTSLRNGGGAEILGQKYNVLSQAIENTEGKLNALKSAQNNMAAGAENGTVSAQQQREYQREIESTVNKLARYKQELEQVSQKLDDTGDSADDAEKETKELGNAIDNAGKSTVTFGDLLKANVLSDFISDGIHRLADEFTGFIKKGVSLASDLQEVQNVVDVTFGDGAAQIYEWSDAAAESFGMSSLSAQKFTGTIGAMLKSQNIASDSIGEMSTALVGLAGDMASFYNLDVEQAFEKIRSGISGETEPLKQLGINMNVANLEAYALSQGIEKTWNSMSVAEQTMLRYNYLLSQTADAQGDFARTSDSYANQQRIMQLNIENLSASLGEKFLPHINDVIVTLNDKLPKAERSIENIGKILGTATSFALEHHEAILGLASAYLTYQGAMKAGKGISDIVGAFKNLTSATKTATAAQQGMNAAAAANPYVLLASAIAAVTVGLITLSAASDETSTKLKDAAEQSVADYEEQCDKVSELEEELKSVRDRIEEIQSKGTLSITDETELDNLRQQNGELENQLELEKEILRVKNKQKSDDSLKALYAYKGEGSLNNLESALDDYKRAVEAGSDDINEKENDLLTALTNSQELAGYLDTTSESAAHASDEVDNLKNQIYELIGISPEDENTDIGQIYPNANGSWRNDEYANQYNAEKEAAEKAQKVRDEDLQNYVADLDKKLNLRRISEEQYYSDLKNYLDIHTDTESVAWYKQLERYEDYEAKKLEASEKAAEENQKIAEDTAKKQKELSEKEIEDKISALKEKQELNDDYTEEMMYNEMEIIISGLDKESDLYKKYNSEILKGRKSLADEQMKILEKSAEEQAKELSDAYDKLKEQKEQVRDELLDIDLSETIKDKDGNDVELLTDLDAEVKKIDKYESSLARLKETGISDSLLEKIKGMNYEDGSRQRFIDTLLGLSPDKLQIYYDDWDRYQAKADEASLNAIADDVEDLNKEASDAVDNIFGNMTDSAYKSGAETWQNFLQGIKDGMNGVGISDPALMSQVLSGNFNVSGEPSGKSASAESGLKAVLWDTPLTFVFGDKQHTTTIGDLIEKGRLTGGNVLNI